MTPPPSFQQESEHDDSGPPFAGETGLPAEPGAAGARLTFDEMYRTHADAVYRYCLVLLRNPAEAEDVGADVFFSAFRSYERVQPGADRVRPWLFRIARNAVIDHVRSQGTRRRLLQALKPAAARAETVESTAGLRSDLHDVIHSMATLRRRKRELISLRLAAGLSYAEIGAAVGMSEGAARMATERALAELRQQLQSEWSA